MKKTIKNTFCLVFFCFQLSFYTGIAQNTIPVFSNVKAVVDDKKREVRVFYDVTDKEDAFVNVNIELSDNGNLLTAKKLKGDVGTNVSIGTRKKIVWKYHKTTVPNTIKVTLKADDGKIFEVADLVKMVDTMRLKKSVAYLTSLKRNHNAENKEELGKARTYIKNMFTDNGVGFSIQDSVISNRDLTMNLAEAYRDQRDLNDSIVYKLENIIGSIPGQKQNTNVLILGAHYDAVIGSPGADDNASGLAGLLEVARILSKSSFKKQIQFACFDLEEAGFLGSKLYIYDDRNKMNNTVEAFINYDMIGYYSDKDNTQYIPEGFDYLFPEAAAKVAANNYKGDFVIVTSNNNSGDVSDTFSTEAGKYVKQLNTVQLKIPDNGMTSGLLAAGDHSMFWANNVPAIHLGDGAPTRNRNYHGPDDKAKTLNYEFMGNIVKATIAALAKLAIIQNTAEYTIEVPPRVTANFK